MNAGQQVLKLLDLQLQGLITPEQRGELLNLLGTGVYDGLLDSHIQASIEEISHGYVVEIPSEVSADHILQAVKQLK